jgi:hypothetical protein
MKAIVVAVFVIFCASLSASATDKIRASVTKLQDRLSAHHLGEYS